MIPLDARADWNAALAGVPHAFAHTWASCHAMSLTTGLPTYLYRFELDDVRIVCPIAERAFAGRVDIVTPYGFSGFAGTGDCPAFPRHWREFASARGYVCGYVGLNPLLWRDSYGQPDDVHQYNHIYTLDLSPTLESLYASLLPDRRRQLRHREQALMALIHERPVLIDFLLRHHDAFLTRRRASRASHLSSATLSALVEQDNVFLVGAGNGEVEAVSAFAYTETIGDHLFNVSAPGGERHSTLLIWYGIVRLKALNVPVLNLGGGIRENDGVAEFKKRFGTTTRPLKSLKQVYDHEAFESLCRRVGADPADRRGYFPPYRTP